MESLAVLVAILLLFAFLGGPIAIALTKIRTEHFILTIARRIAHGFFATISLWVGMMFFINTGLPLLVHLIGLYALSMGYIAFRREYFPDVRIIAPLLKRFGVNGRTRTAVEGKDSSMNETASKHGPVMKWRRHGSSGRDGHGPEGQH